MKSNKLMNLAASSVLATALILPIGAGIAFANDEGTQTTDSKESTGTEMT
ncbi:hypothetical protein [Bacillus sp. S/N-304-OC-R1]|nr:hypothetical protein [Bacillus sp. S/N-304-OC-R1]MBY0124344.1 hypothetical protein [Bacillus sp. S/N-304-OC-R1]